MKKAALLLLFLCGFSQVFAQNFTRRDSLQGASRPQRTCFDILRYDLNIRVNPESRAIFGHNDITFKIVGSTTEIQIDLFENMQVDSILFHSQKLMYKREFGAVFIYFPNQLAKDSEQKLKFYYSGKPKVAKRAPWDGGFVFKKDSSGKPWINVAVEDVGASLWFPCKDTQTDEPDQGVTMKVAVPNGLVNVSNGRLTGYEDLKDGYTRWDWEVKNPINNYNMTLNIGDYVHFGENHNGLDLDFYVLRENEQKARKQFQQVRPMLDCFEQKFGPYPFKEDSFKLIESSYAGMEHQSGVAYGNGFENGYGGSDISGTGIGMLFDYIIIHETGHEWFGNSITAKDSGDLWIHESFTTYSEAVYVECLYGYEKAQRYVNGLRQNFYNDKPIVGPMDVNSKGSYDMYYKGALMLNTIRHIINDDAKWWKIIKDFSLQFRHKIIDAQTVFEYFNSASGINLTPIFKQYLYYVSLPVLELKIGKNQVSYRWKTDVPDFTMPAIFKISGKEKKVQSTTKWKTLKQKFHNRKEIQILEGKFLMDVSIVN